MQQIKTSQESTSNLEKGVASALGIVEKYLLLSEIGEDHLYPVFLAASIDFALSHSNSGSQPFVVIKAMPTTDKRNSFENEYNILQLKAHKNIIKCFKIIKNAKLNFKEYQDEEYNLLVLEYHSNGDLLDFIKRRRLDENSARFYFEQMLDAVENLHYQGYTHRDLKIENFLVDDNFNLVLTDFGHSVRHSDGLGPRIFNDKYSVTTPGICPPEYYQGKGYKGTEMDIFAMGKLLMILVTGFNPFKTTKEIDQNYSLISKGNWSTFWKLTSSWMKKKWLRVEDFTPEFKDLIERMLSPNPSLRPTIEEIRESSWFVRTQPSILEEVQSIMLRAKSSF